MDVPGLPSLLEGDMYSCFFEEAETAASVQGTTVTCATPEAHRLPPVQQGEGKTTHMQMMFGFPESVPMKTGLHV